MRPNDMIMVRQYARHLGSMWFGAVLLVVLILAMACATVFESTHGSEWALSSFYRAWWFELLLALLGLNMFAAVVVRYPFARRQSGFVVTHASIIVMFLGMVVTKYCGVEGQLGLAEGETLDFIALPQATATLINRTTGVSSTVDLHSSVGAGLRAIDMADGPVLTLEKTLVVIDRYLPDSTYTERVEEDSEDAARSFPAVEVSLSPSGRTEPRWLILGQTTNVGSSSAMLRLLDAADVSYLLARETTSQARSSGTLRVEREGTTYEIPLEDCTEKPVPIGDTAMTVQVTHYLPHASVTIDEHVVNLSANPVNPAVQITLTAGEEVQTRILFAKAPEFRSVQGSEALSHVNVTFVRPVTLAAQAPIEVFGGPDGRLYVRFTWEGTIPSIHEVSVNEPIDTPWPGKKFAVLRRYERARRTRLLTEVRPIRKERISAVHAWVTTSDGTEECWVRRRMPIDIENDGMRYELMFGDSLFPLGFKVKLDRFAVGYYPGSNHPRSFESLVSFIDGETGRAQSRVISMNHPATYGGYTFYQSSYDVDSGTSISFLSVARDPGQPIVFVGYIGTLVGMVLVLAIRMQERRSRSSSSLRGLDTDVRATTVLPTVS